jgi:hypothetical protein
VTQPHVRGFNQLELVMGAFAHIVGFNEAAEAVLHMHPLGAPFSRRKVVADRTSSLIATKAGFARLFAQVQVGGRQVLVSFGVRLLP